MILSVSGSEGEFVKAFCTEQDQTVCSPCDTGFYSSAYTMFSKCEECLSCPQGKSENNDERFQSRRDSRPCFLPGMLTVHFYAVDKKIKKQQHCNHLEILWLKFLSVDRIC